MARKPNYGAEKRQKELQRQKKRDEKAEKKALKRDEAAAGDPDAGAEDGPEGLAPEASLDQHDRDAGG